jgi:hypothetical protein
MAKGKIAGRTKRPPPPPKAPGRPTLPRPRGEFAFTVPEAGAMINLSAASSYKAARNGEIPTVRIGSLLIVPRTAWLKKLGVEDAVEESVKAPPTQALPQRGDRRCAKACAPELSD